MPREIFPTGAPLSAAGSAAHGANKRDDYSETFIPAVEANYVKPRFRVVAGGAPLVDPVVRDNEYPVIVRASDYGGAGWDDDWFDSGKAFEARLEARMDNGHGGSKAPFLSAAESGKNESKTKEKKANIDRGPNLTQKSEYRYPGLKKLNKKQIALDMPPTPRGCEWRRSDDGFNLWSCRTEWDDDKTMRIKKTRYAGHLSDEAWRIMKEYDHEAFISTVGERLRRHSGR